FWHRPEHGNPFEAALKGKWDADAMQLTGANAGLGALAWATRKNPTLALGALMGAPLKDLLIRSNKAVPSLEKSISGIHRNQLVGAGLGAGLGAGALGLGGYGIYKLMKTLREKEDRADSREGKIKVRL